jgi:peptide deformylase
MKHEILTMGDPRLLRQAQPVAKEEFDTPALHELIADMFEVMRAADGAGLAAPQIGIDKRLVVFGFEENARYPDAYPVPETILLNPVITLLSEDMEEAWEGCLSVPGLRGVVSRYAKVRYQGFDQYGTPIDRIAEGFHARVVQHECDHLDGILYPMRMTDFSRFGFQEALVEAGILPARNANE